MKNKYIVIVGLIVLVSAITFIGKTTGKPLGGVADGSTELRGTTTVSSSTVTTASTLLMATSSDISYRAIVVDGATDVYLGVGVPAVSGKGIRLNANGGAYEINKDNLFTGAIYGISSASVNVTTLEK